MPPPPFDRAIALACAMHTLRARWLYVSSTCGASQARSVRLMLQANPTAAGYTLADVVVRIRCYVCRQSAATIHLCADARTGQDPSAGDRSRDGACCCMSLVRLGDQLRRATPSH